MKLLLDTHALLWLLADDARLGQQARGRIADPDNVVLVSAVSLWEIVVKVRVGKLVADIGEIVAAIERQGFATLPIEPKHLEALASLPLHADHMRTTATRSITCSPRRRFRKARPSCRRTEMRRATPSRPSHPPIRRHDGNAPVFPAAPSS